MRAGVIINPAAGRGARDSRDVTDRVRRAERVAAAAGVRVDVVVTTSAGHAAEHSRAFVAAGVDVVVAWGGDGTINEVAGPLLGSPVALGIVPAGSGNGLARTLGIPLVPDAALATAFGGAERRVDVATFGQRHFLNIAGVGFDAEVAQAFNRRRTRGVLGYVIDSLSGVWRYCPASYGLELDGRDHTGDYFVVVFANGTQYGNGLAIAPDADICDGRLNAVLVSGGSAVQQLWRARRLLVRPLAPAAGVRRQTVGRAVISGERLQCHVDGESFVAEGPVVVNVLPGALGVRSCVST